MKALIKRFIGFIFVCFGGLWLIKRKIAFPTLIVLNYHSFSYYNNYRFKRGDITKSGFQKMFEKQLIFLKKHFNFCTPEEFYSDKSKKGISFFITFDDGYKDNYDIAFPILKKHTIPAAFFIVCSMPDSDNWLFHDKIRFLAQKNLLNKSEVESILKSLNQGKEIAEGTIQLVENEWAKLKTSRLMMNWDEIKTLSEAGFIIGSHTHTHSPLLFLSPDQQKKELRESMELLSKKINKNITHFAYPNGLYDEKCSQLLKEEAIQYAYTTNAGGNSQTESPLEIKRLGINASDTIGMILLKIYLSLRK